MRQYIADRLDEMKSVTEKDMLRDVMENIFIPMYENIEGQYQRLERRVREEMPLKVSNYAIWSTLMERENAVGGCPYLFPILDEDLHKPEIEVSEIQERLRNEKEIRLDTVFLQADYLTCRALENSGEIFSGILRTESGEIDVGIRLRISKRYADGVHSLYKLFISNGIPWQTINSPYIFKMFDVMLIRADLHCKEASGIVSGYEVVFGEYNEQIRRGLVPAWNVCKQRIKSEDFPLAALDKVNYEYLFELDEDESDYGYLADYNSADISAMRREENTLIVTSPAPRGIIFDMFKIMKHRDYATDNFIYELTNNTLEDSFATRMVSHYGTVIKTNAELRRLLGAYDVSSYIELNSAQIVYGAVEGETYEVNGFLKDEIRDVSVSKSLLLKFRPLKRHPYILRDVMSFLVSQVQLIYPEFRCVGVLL